MACVDAQERRSSTDLLVVGVVATAALVALYWPLWIYLAHLGTRDDGDEGLGIVAWAVAAWLVSERRDALKSLPIEPDRWGWCMVAAGSLLALMGHRLTMHFLLSLSLPLVFGGCLWCVCGRRWVGALWFPLLVLVGTTPLPGVVAKGIGFPMQRMVAQLSAVVLDLLGMPVQVSGVSFLFGGHTVQVSEGCSGWRSFSAAAWLLLVLLYRQRPASWFYWLWYPALMLPLTVVANLMRVVTVVAGIRIGQPWVAVSPWHEMLGMCFFVPAAWLVVSMIGSGPTAPPREADLSPAASPAHIGGARLWGLVAALWIVSAMGMYAHAQASAVWRLQPLPELPERVGVWKREHYERPDLKEASWHVIGIYRDDDDRQLKVDLQVPVDARGRPYAMINWMLKHGSVLDGKETTSLDTGRRKVPVCVATMHGAQGPATVAVTYLGRGSAFSDPLEARFRLLGSELLGRAGTPWLMVAVVAPDEQTALDWERHLLAPAEEWVASCR